MFLLPKLTMVSCKLHRGETPSASDSVFPTVGLREF